MADEKHEHPQYAEDVVPSGLILSIAVGTIVFALVLCGIAWLILRVEENRLRPSHRFPEKQLAAPRTVSEVRQQLFELTTSAPTPVEEQRAQLDSFGWIDRSQRVVRIPVEKAIDLYLERQARP